MTDRPLECTGCQRPIKIIYKEIAGNAIATTEMCDQCPIFQKKMGIKSAIQVLAENCAHHTLCCDRCHTDLETLLTEGRLGCSDCYHIFEALLVEEMLCEDLLPPRFKTSLEVNRTTSLHIGHTPHSQSGIALSSQLKELNEALNEALNKENYEEAAYLRDQIKNLMSHSDD